MQCRMFCLWMHVNSFQVCRSLITISTSSRLLPYCKASRLSDFDKMRMSTEVRVVAEVIQVLGYRDVKVPLSFGDLVETLSCDTYIGKWIRNTS